MYVIVNKNNECVTDPGTDEIEVFNELHDTEVTLAALHTSLAFMNFEAVKVTIVDYCGECHMDFEPETVVHYAPIENNCFCNSCKDELNIRDWEKRFYKGCKTVK